MLKKTNVVFPCCTFIYTGQWMLREKKSQNDSNIDDG